MNPLRHSAGMLLLVALAAVALSAGGCVPSHPMKNGEMDRMWTPVQSPWAQAEPDRPRYGGSELPYRYEVQYESSNIWSAVQLYNASQKFPGEEDTLVLPISTDIAHSGAEMLADLAAQVNRMALALPAADQSGLSHTQWAAEAADLIGRIHAIYAMANPSIEERGRITLRDSAAWVILPLLEVITRTLPPAGTTAAERLALVEEGERGMVRVVLTAAFRITGRRLDLQAVQDVLQVQRTQPPARARANTAKLLLWYFHATPRRYERLPQSARGMANWSLQIADGMRYLASLSDQWPKVQYLAMELRRNQDQRLVALEFSVREGQRVVLRNLDFLVPDLECTGRGRIVFVQSPRDSEPDGKSLTALFDAVDGGAITFRFRGIYLLARLLAVPVDDARFKQVQVRLYRTEQGESVRSVVLLMESIHPGGGDNRRVLEYDIITRSVLKPRKTLPPQLVGQTVTRRLTYGNGQRIWEMARQQFTPPELWRGPTP